MEQYYRIPIDQYAYAVSNTKKPKYVGAFKNYSAFYNEMFAYVKGEVKEEYQELLINKDDVTIFTAEEYQEALNRLKQV